MRIPFLLMSFVLLSCHLAKKEDTKTVNEKTTNRSEAINQIDQLNKAIQSDTSNARLYNNRAAYYFAIQEYALAEKDLIKSLNINPADATTWDNYGSLKGRQNKFSDAYNAYRKALKLSPTDPQFLNNSGWALLNMGRFKESLSFFDKAISFDNNMTTAYTNKGLALLGLKRKEEACKLLKFSFERGVKEARVYIDKYCQ